MNYRPFSTSSYRLANSTPPSTELNFKSTDGPKATTLENSNEEENGFKVTRSPSKRRIDLTGNDCLKFDCPSGCCIDGQCVNNSQCAPAKAPRGGPPPPPPGGGVKIGIKSSFPGWGWYIVFGGMMALPFTWMCYIYCCRERCKRMSSFIRARR